MAKKVLIIETSLRSGSNSDILAESFAKGAKDAGKDVEIVSLKGKKINFCSGCFACQKLGKCIIDDDANDITEKILEAEVIVWATPIYYYEMSGQMKTMIDRANSLYPRDYRFREVYLLTTAAEDETYTDEKAVSGVKGWVDCFEKAEFKGKIFAGGVNEREEIKGSKALEEAYSMGGLI